MPALPSVIPHPLVAGELAVQGHGVESQFFAGLPDQRPGRAAGDALPLTVGLGGAVNSVPAGITSLPAW
jgi:hypothetical protein